jgi:phage terminase small subunit
MVDLDNFPPKQRLFIHEYLVDLNATQAATRAGYSPKTAETQGSRLLRNVQVAAAIQEFMDERAAELEIDAGWVLEKAVDLFAIAETHTQKLRALELVGKHIKVNAFKTTLDVNVSIGIGDRLTEARQRAREALAMAEVLSNG